MNKLRHRARVMSCKNDVEPKLLLNQKWNQKTGAKKTEMKNLGFRAANTRKEGRQG